ncbi:MAG: hypothetical protein FWD13_09590 [Treponema sp.]|nr:hypothetical protein [Treponema sp.]
MDNKFSEISGIFSQFSEENKDVLIEMAKGLLNVQKEESNSQNDDEERCSEN